ncbi:hypothetical protein [Mycoplasma sp. P36-A1]|uniref:hypothetical protein n=1 Tax=Mycoplasma sp. P36-A1 TaxID=3252900 RepID=UPI003C2FC4BD
MCKNNFIYIYDYYDYYSIEESFIVEKVNEYNLIYFGSINEKSDLPNTPSDINVKNYDEIINVKLIIK